MNIKPVKTEEDYQQAMRRLEKIFHAEPGSKEDDELEILSILIEKYEDEHYPIAPPDPIEAIKFRMEQMNYSQNELAEIIGQQKSKASEILSKKRKLSLSMIRKLSDKLHIPSDVLIQPY